MGGPPSSGGGGPTGPPFNPYAASIQQCIDPNRPVAPPPGRFPDKAGQFIKKAFRTLLNMDANALFADPTKLASFKASFITALAFALNIAENNTNVDSVTAASVAVASTVNFPADAYSQADVSD